MRRTVHHVVAVLETRGRLELRGVSPSAVAESAVALLQRGSGHQSLVPSLVDALLRCPGVEELYADNDEIREIITDLGQ